MSHIAMSSKSANFLSIESVSYFPVNTLQTLEICNRPMLPHSPLYPQHIKLALHMKDATLVELRGKFIK